jgi:D-beta-D-heptose 7-phosphate kinase/D-beta-D-heptose 1-phosphate adenosyltransferase
MSEKPSVLVIGDVMLDRRIEGQMTRISLEAPAPIIRQEHIVESPGGAGNVARNVATLGCDVQVLGVVGHNDYGANALTHLLGAAGVGCCLPHGPEGSCTVTKTRIGAAGQYIVRVDEEAGQLSNDAEIIQGMDHVLHEGTSTKLICVADYDKGTMTEPVARHLIERSVELKIPVFVDCRPNKTDFYHGVELLKPNIREAQAMLDDWGRLHPGVIVGEPDTLVQELRKLGGFGSVLLTMGGDGCAYYDPQDEKIHNFQGSQQQIYDVCGAGDTVMAAMAVGYVEGVSFHECVQFSMYAAGLVVRHHGVVPAYRDAVDEFRYEACGWAAKAMSEADAMAFVARRKRKDQVIVLTNGCFDGVHAGHIETLRHAKRQGHALVVAYNDDESLRACKGESRPLVPDSFRASHLAQLACVDAVFRFDGDMEGVVRRFKPDVLVKGEDSAAAGAIPGADYVAAHGGRVSLAPVTLNLSSSRLCPQTPVDLNDQS